MEDKYKFFKDDLGNMRKIQSGELVNPHRRFINKVCDDLDITRKQLRKKMKRGTNKEFCNEIQRLWTEFQNKFELKQ